MTKQLGKTFTGLDFFASLSAGTTTAMVLALSFTLCGAGSCGSMLGMGPGVKSFTDCISQGQNDEKNGDYAAAEKDYTDAVSAAEQKYGKEAPQTATSLGYLASMYKDRQDYLLAEKTYKRLIDIYQKIEPNGSDLAQKQQELELVESKIKEYNLKNEKTADSDKKSDDKKAAAAKGNNKSGKGRHTH